MKLAPRACLLALAAGAPLLAQPGAGPRAFVEVELSRETCYVKEPITVTLRVGVDREFFAAHAIPLLRREVDLPVHVELGPLGGRGALAALPARAVGDERRLTLARDDQIIAARVVTDRIVAGRAFTVVEFESACYARQAGVVRVPAPRLRFAHTTRFETQFLAERVAVDRHDETVVGDEKTLTVLDLPEKGRPREFTGAVGRYSISAELSRRGYVVGEVGKLVLRVRGDGVLDFVGAPRLDGLAGFHVYGRLEHETPGERAFTYDIAPLRASLRELPRVRFAYFDPGPDAPGYRVVQTEPIEIAVQPLPPGKRLDLPAGVALDGPVAGVDDIHGPRAGAIGGDAGVLPAPGELLLWLALPWTLAALAVALRASCRRAAVRGPGASRLKALARELAAPGGDRAYALAKLLAGEVGCEPAALIEPDVARRLAGAGLPQALAARAQERLEALVAARYGSGERAPEVGELLDLARSVQRARSELSAATEAAR